MSDNHLLDRAVQGDGDALEALLKQHAPAARRGLGRKIPRRWRSVLSEDDVMQQTYADAIRDIAQFDTQRDGSFSGWLTSLARCNLRDAIRMLKAQKRGGDRTRIELPQDGSSHVVLVEQLAGPGASPSSHAGQDEIQTALERALRQLPPSYQKAVEMYDLEGEPVARIAQALGRSPGAVYMLRARALDWLREIMGSSTKFFTDFS